MVALNASLFVASLVAFVAGSFYILVGGELRKRVDAVAAESRKALQFFTVWWFALGFNIVLTGLFYLGASLGYTNFPLQLSYASFQRLLLAVSLVGLMYYLLYLLTGKNWLPVLVPFYAVHFIFLIYSMYANEPKGLYIGNWRTDIEYTHESAPVFQLANFAMTVVPPVLASLAYFFIGFPRSRDRARRYRIALVSWSLTIWWIMAVVAGQRESFGNEEFQFVNRFFGLLVALAILAAYRPPALIRQWLERGTAAAEPAPA